MPLDYTKSEYQTTLKNEEWRPIPGYPHYEASSLGRIRSVFVHILKPKLNYRTLKDGPEYELVVIRARRVLIHRLVALAFIGPRPEGYEVNHKNHNKRHNAPTNIEYVTKSENIRQAYRAGRIGLKYKLNALQQSKVIEMYESGQYTTKRLGEQFGVSACTIRSLLKIARVPLHKMKKATPALYKEIQDRWVPFKYPVSQLVKDYGLSRGQIEYILGMRSDGRGKHVARVPNHPMELVKISTDK